MKFLAMVLGGLVVTAIGILSNNEILIIVGWILGIYGIVTFVGWLANGRG